MKILHIILASVVVILLGFFGFAINKALKEHGHITRVHNYISQFKIFIKCVNRLHDDLYNPKSPVWALADVTLYNMSQNYDDACKEKDVPPLDVLLKEFIVKHDQMKVPYLNPVVEKSIAELEIKLQTDK